MASTKHAARGMELEFQPGSRGRVLRNLLGITRVRDMEQVESQALAAVQRAALEIYGPSHRFTPADIRGLHRMWLGAIYPWASPTSVIEGLQRLDGPSRYETSHGDHYDGRDKA